MIDTLIFDLGGVIVNLDNDQVKAALLELGMTRIGMFLKRDKIKRLMNDFIDGLRPTEDVLTDMQSLCRKGTTHEEILKVVGKLVGDLPKSRLELLVELRKKYQVFLLSNINDVLWDMTLKQMEQLGYSQTDCFDEVFLSYEMQLAKPDPSIYFQVIKETGMNPASTLYFDDRRDNAEAGKEAGMKAVLVKTNHLEESLKEAGLM